MCFFEITKSKIFKVVKMIHKSQVVIVSIT